MHLIPPVRILVFAYTERSYREIPISCRILHPVQSRPILLLRYFYIFPFYMINRFVFVTTWYSVALYQFWLYYHYYYYLFIRVFHITLVFHIRVFHIRVFHIIIYYYYYFYGFIIIIIIIIIVIIIIIICSLEFFTSH